MGNNNMLRKIEILVAILAWKVYVAIYWRTNKEVQKKLTKDVGENLGYYLSNPKGTECNYQCHYHEPYGFVPEAGCPFHDI